MKIDVHAHYIPESCLELQGEGPPPVSLVGDMTDLGTRLRDMDAMGVDLQVPSTAVLAAPKGWGCWWPTFFTRT